MIKVVAKLTVKETQIEEFKGVVPELVMETRKEAGCISYQLFQDVKDPKVLSFIEEWESQEALDQHIQSKHFQTIFPKLTQMVEKDAELNIYSVLM